MSLRLGVDTGGTFTDVVATDADGRSVIGKAPTTPQRPALGILEAIAVAAERMNRSQAELLAAADVLTYGTTFATNAIITGATPRTAFLCTEGHPDILTFREAGRMNGFDFSSPFPEPYVPRQLTFEIPGRIDANGEELIPLTLNLLARSFVGSRA